VVDTHMASQPREARRQQQAAGQQQAPLTAAIHTALATLQADYNTARAEVCSC